jgi:NADH-quinone oxidoreductase subunit C
VIRAVVDEECQIPTISDIFDGADWHERETRDFYGIVFSDHPYLKPLILAEEDVDLKPLLKKEADLKEMGEVSWAPASAAAPKSEAPTPKPEAKKRKRSRVDGKCSSQ